MVFDAKKYADAMDRFHILIANVSELDSPEIGHALEEVCRVLRVAKVDMKCYDAISLEKRKNGNYFLLYEGAEPDENRVYIKRESTDRGNVVIYSFYKINDGVEWNEEESKRVGVLQTCLFAYNARARLAQIADQFTFHDTQLGMYNLNFLMKHAGALISEGTVEHYGVCYFNLKHFSVVNQRFGRDRGTKIMVDYIGRLETLLGDTELVCRVGGDNFIVLFLKEKLESSFLI